MSDNTKNYNIVINTEVNGEGDLSKLNNTVEETGEKFKKLQTQIKETKVALQQAVDSGDAVGFKKLKSELDNLEDSFEKVNNKSKQLDDQLVAMPGALGNVGQGIKSVDGLMKLLSANPLLAVLGAVVGVFLLVKKSLDSTKEGTAALTKVTDAFGSVIKPIFEWISSIAVPVINKFAEGIEWLSSAMGNVKEPINIVTEEMKKQAATIEDARKKYEDIRNTFKEYEKKIADLKSRYEELSEGEKQWIIGLEKQKNSLIPILNETYKTYKKFITDLKLLDDIKYEDDIKNLNAKEKEIYDINLKYQKDLTDLKKSGLGEKVIKDGHTNLQLLEEQHNDKINKINKKYSDIAKTERDKVKAQQLSDLKAAEQVIYNTEISFLDDRNKELKILETKYINDQKILKKAGFNETSAEMIVLTESYNNEIYTINQKHIKISTDLQKKTDEDKIAKAKETADKLKLIRADELMGQYDELNAMIDAMDTRSSSWQLVLDIAIEKEVEIFKNANDVTAENQEFFQNRINAIYKKGSDKRLQIITNEIDETQAKFMGYVNLAADFGGLLENISSLTNKNSEEGFEAGKKLSIAAVVVSKAASIADIISSTMAANAKAVGLFPLTAGQPFVGINTASAVIGVASTLATAAASIAEINNAKFGGGSGSGGSSQLPTYPSAPVISAPQIQLTQQDTVGQSISNTISNANSKPTKVYVTSQDMSSTQQLDRRTKQAATF